MKRQIFKAFEYPEFRLMWLGACTSSIGTWMQNLAQSWLVYELTKSAWYLGLDAFLGQIPIFLFSMLGGVVADRKDRRKVLVCSQLVQMCCAITLALLAWFEIVQVWHVLVLSFIVGTAQSFGGPAYQAMIPSLVKKEDLQNAIAMNSIQFNVARVIGPTLGGVALAKLGASWCFSLNALSFLAVIFTLLRVAPRPPAMTGKEPVLESMKVGLRFVRDNSVMGGLIVLAFFMTLLGGSIMTFLPVFAERVFHLGKEAFSEMLVISGIGSVVGGIFVAATSGTQHKGMLSLLSLMALGGFIFGFAVSSNFCLACAMLFLGGAALIACYGLVSSLVQSQVEDSMRGRVMSIYNVAFRGGMPFGAFASGRLIESFTAPQVLAANGILLVVLSGIFLLSQRKIARL
ncbi:MAG: MFS transporter [Acidobacteria bacterium]|nr:MFS transporter [Acidobacteriota bacterium]